MANGHWILFSGWGPFLVSFLSGIIIFLSSNTFTPCKDQWMNVGRMVPLDKSTAFHSHDQFRTKEQKSLRRFGTMDHCEGLDRQSFYPVSFTWYFIHKHSFYPVLTTVSRMTKALNSKKSLNLHMGHLFDPFCGINHWDVWLFLCIWCDHMWSM